MMQMLYSQKVGRIILEEGMCELRLHITHSAGKTLWEL